MLFEQISLIPIEMKKEAKLTTLKAVMDKLQWKRYDNEFTMTSQGFRAPNGKYYLPEDLKIIKSYFFYDDNSDNASIQVFVSAKLFLFCIEQPTVP